VQASIIASTRPASACSKFGCCIVMARSDRCIVALASLPDNTLLCLRKCDDQDGDGADEFPPMNQTPAIAFADVSKRFTRPDGGALPVLDGITFDVPAGEIVAILGPSGAGKSTLLNIAAGLLMPDRGRVLVMGRDTAEPLDWRCVGYMFQDDRLLPWRVAAANVSLALEAGGMAVAERRARSRAGLALVGLADFADAYPHQLSGGMRSRVALARSLVGEPQILLMDEPFSRLDAQTRSAMHAEVLRIQALRRMSILFVTHDVEEAVVLADHIVMMSPRPGRVRRIVAVTLLQPRLDKPETVELVTELRGTLGDAERQEEMVQ
jgi:ABC-type nitrate/sulfonate/bicarbonate transport system ATPase subunit